MLKSISWLQFIEFIFFGTLLYYGWILAKFFHLEIKSWITGEKKPENPGNTGNPGKLDKADTPGKVAEIASGANNAGTDNPASPHQAALFSEKPITADQTPELFKVMERVITLLKEVITQGIEHKIQRDELLGRFKDILRGYHHLNRTAYQVAINNFLIRSCSSNFSLPLTDEDLEELWR